jgi:hypothetical protein
MINVQGCPSAQAGARKTGLHHARLPVANWMINNQLGRRNVTADQASYLRGKRYNAEKRPDDGHGDQKSGGHSGLPKKAEELAEEFKVSERTIRRDGDFAAAMDVVARIGGEKVRKEILSRESRVDRCA